MLENSQLFDKIASKKNRLFSNITGCYPKIASCRWLHENNRLLFPITGIDDQGLYKVILRPILFFSETILCYTVPAPKHIICLFSISNSIIGFSKIFGNIKTNGILRESISNSFRFVFHIECKPLISDHDITYMSWKNIGTKFFL